ncbi:MAG: MerR family transcriptional regulator [Dehalococcoidales bacterium]|nr:MerR family transcriptional regulator [Dehalococcoidales bacterium]
MTEYSVKQMAKFSGLSIRTLHFYDQKGLLKPCGYGTNGYRKYGQKELIRLQQIMFFRELDFKLEEIKDILDRPGFDITGALRDHRRLLEEKIDRYRRLIETVHSTILKIKGDQEMSENEYYTGFSREQQEKYREEIRQKYGTKALDESEQRMKSWSKQDFTIVNRESDRIFSAIKDKIEEGYDSPAVQEEIKKLYNWLNRFYECDLTMLRGIGQMYRKHPDFARMYRTRYHENMPVFLCKAIEYYCDLQSAKEGEN